MKFNFGCNDKAYEGFVNVDRDKFDLNKPLKLGDECAEEVVLFDVVEHVLNHEVMMKEVYRILKPGGLLSIRTPNYRGLATRLKLLFGNDSPFDCFLPFDHVHFYTDRTLVRELKKAGFDDFEFVSVSHYRVLPFSLQGTIFLKAWKRGELL